MKGLYALVGMKHRGTEAFVSSLPAGTQLLLMREPDNKFDPNAIQVWASGEHVGYIKASQVRPLALAMDANPALAATPVPCGFKATLRKKEDRWPMVEVE